jgi:L-cystine transport system permease protein
MSIGNLHNILTLICQIAEKLPVTLLIMVGSLVLGSLLGISITVIKLGKNRALNLIITGYVSFLRGTPPLVQLFLIFYGLPKLLGLIGIDVNDWDKTLFAILTFSLHSSAFISEVLRSAYLAVDKGQREAALSVGMSGIQAFIRIVFPQAFLIALPNIGNTMIRMLKETSLAFTIGITDIMGQVTVITGRCYGANQLELYIIIAFIYWIICIMIENGISALERYYRKGHREFAV